jgi:DHA1 family multidrug resistance protein-like MFS transporter
VQTAQRLGPAVGPIIGGVIAGFVGLRRSFVVTAAVYAIGLLFAVFLYDERATRTATRHENGKPGVRFADVIALEHFVVLMVVIFVAQFADRSFGPILPLYLEQIGVLHDRVPVAAGFVFSVAALSGAIGHHACGKLLERHSAAAVIAAGAAAASLGSMLIAIVPNAWLMGLATVFFGIGVGVSMTASYAVAAAVIPPGTHGAGFGVLTSASLVGMAMSPVVAGALGGVSLRAVFVVDAVLMAALFVGVRRFMIPRDRL